LKEEDLSNKSEELLAVSPYGKVPVLVVNGEVIYESAVINEYLEETYPEKPLMPEAAYARAQVRIWTDYVASRFVKPLYTMYRSKDPDNETESWAEVNQELEYLNDHFNSNPGTWFIGETFTLADINMLPFMASLIRFDRDVLSRYPGVKNWMKSIQERPSFKETLSVN